MISASEEPQLPDGFSPPEIPEPAARRLRSTGRSSVLLLSVWCAADEAVQYASQTYHDAKDVAQQHISDLERQIRDKPVQAALIAFGVGFVVGTLLSR